jgi:WhiB family redox-sensing transcriptional regulator
MAVVCLPMSHPVPLSGRYIPVQSWASQAACKGKPPEWWFPPKPITLDVRENIDRAREICGTCPVAEPCLDHSLHWESEGIWGGKSSRERRDIRRQRGIPLLFIHVPDSRNVKW